MNTVTTVSLAKCLKLKNRIGGLSAKIQSEIQRFNVVSADDVGRVVNVRESLDKYNELYNLIVELKCAIAKANAGVQERLVKLAELKGRVSFFDTVNTNEGVSKRLNQADVVNVAELKRKEVDEEVRKLQVEIDAIQDSIDLYNHQTMVVIPSRIIELTT